MIRLIIIALILAGCAPTIQAFAAQLGLSSTDLDHLFEKAISFSV